MISLNETKKSNHGPSKELTPSQDAIVKNNLDYTIAILRTTIDHLKQNLASLTVKQNAAIKALLADYMMLQEPRSMDRQPETELLGLNNHDFDQKHSKPGINQSHNNGTTLHLKSDEIVELVIPLSDDNESDSGFMMEVRTSNKKHRRAQKSTRNEADNLDQWPSITAPNQEKNNAPHNSTYKIDEQASSIRSTMVSPGVKSYADVLCKQNPATSSGKSRKKKSASSSTSPVGGSCASSVVDVPVTTLKYSDVLAKSVPGSTIRLFPTILHGISQVQSLNQHRSSSKVFSDTFLSLLKTVQNRKKLVALEKSQLLRVCSDYINTRTNDVMQMVRYLLLNDPALRADEEIVTVIESVGKILIKKNIPQFSLNAPAVLSFLCFLLRDMTLVRFNWVAVINSIKSDLVTLDTIETITELVHLFIQSKDDVLIKSIIDSKIILTIIATFAHTHDYQRFARAFHFLLSSLNLVSLGHLKEVQHIMVPYDESFKQFALLCSSYLTLCIERFQKTGKDSIIYTNTLHETIVFLGWYVCGNEKNKCILRYGGSPIILQKICSLPVDYFIRKR